MKSKCTERFWACFHSLPVHVQKQAHISYQFFKQDPHYPSLHFKCIDTKRQIYSTRIGLNYRAVGRMVDGDVMGTFKMATQRLVERGERLTGQVNMC